MCQLNNSRSTRTLIDDSVISYVNNRREQPFEIASVIKRFIALYYTGVFVSTLQCSLGTSVHFCTIFESDYVSCAMHKRPLEIDLKLLQIEIVLPPPSPAKWFIQESNLEENNILCILLCRLVLLI